MNLWPSDDEMRMLLRITFAGVAVCAVLIFALGAWVF
jgi:hypothetical protein